MPWMSEKKVNLLMQFSLAKHADLPNVLLVMDLAKTDEQRLILKSDLRPAGDGASVCGAAGRAEGPAPRRCSKAFMDTMSDKEFLAEAEKAKFEITPVSGDDLERMVQDIYATTPRAVAIKAAEMIK